MPGSLSVAASRAVVKHPLESLIFAIDFHRVLAAGELLAGELVVSATPAGLNLGTPAINPLPVNDEVVGTIPAGTLVQLRIAEGIAGTDYTLTVTALSTQGNTRAAVCTLQVRTS